MDEVEDVRSEGGAFTPSEVSMEGPVVQLEIPAAWMLWRVYHAKGGPLRVNATEHNKGGVKDDGWDLQARWDWDRNRYFRRGDPMDEEGFDEGASFPAFKPDRDLFGPPRRCRKQRGWYHVKPWRLAAHNVPRGEHATGADVPPELFDNIVQGCVSGEWSSSGLGALRLVCRHWEKLCTRSYLCRFSLRTHEDVHDKLAALEKRRTWGWPAYPARSLDLHLDVAHASPAWVHLAQTQLVPRLDADPSMTMQITGPLPAGRRLTSVYLSAPCRALWRPLHVQRLALTDLRFARPNDLVRVLRELPFVLQVCGARIAWDVAPGVYPRATACIPVDLAGPRRRNTALTRYEFSDCSAGLAAILACTLAPSGAPPIAQPDAHVLCALASAVQSAPPHTATPQRSFRINGGLDICDHTVHVGLVPTLLRSQTCMVEFVALDSSEARVADLSFWDSVSECVDQLVARPDLFVIFPSLQRAGAFHRDMPVPALSRLFQQGRLKYVLVEAEEETWSVVDPGGDGAWQVLATARYYHGIKENKQRTMVRQLANKLAARLPGH